MITGDTIRSKFLDFFQSKGHTIVRSDSLVPKDDPTVLFTTAGMQQFKRQFLGEVDDFRRAATAQKCLRTDDLDEVGRTDFHHTFFEMLGNFSFGDYFKKEAITWAWEFLTKVLNIQTDKLWVSVYEEDAEAADIWLNHIKIPKGKLVRLGDKSNFWPSEAKTRGPNGPCGPCSEIFFDYGINPDCPRGDQCDPACDCGRFSEIWNLVFTQYNRREDGTLEPLPSKNIDTGMGLERLTAVMQGKKNNFETDLFAPIIAAIGKEIEQKRANISRREKLVVADHLRAIVMAIADGVMPSNEGRGYVIKRLIIDITDILLRAGINNPHISRLVPVVQSSLEIYPEIKTRERIIVSTINKIEEAYLRIRKEKIPALSAELSSCSDAEQLGKIIFTARDTHGLTIPTILSTATEKGVPEELQEAGLIKFNKLMQQQQERSRAASKMAGDVFADADLDLGGIPKTGFLGYEQTRTQGKILKIFTGKQETDAVHKDQAVKIILDQTPFYAESGGQVGDTGTLSGAQGTVDVENTLKIGDIFIHSGTVADGTLNTGQMVDASVDHERRLSIMRNHTATHLVQAALRQILGEHVQQQGSLVDEERLRFDFTHPKGLSEREIQDIEAFVFRAIMADKPVSKEVLPLEQAKQKGALAFFEENYGDTVRVVSVEDYSREFCGGTHLKRTGQIGLLKITGETAIAQGIRRLEAKTGWGAFELINRQQRSLEKTARMLKSPPDEIEPRLDEQNRRLKNMSKELEHFRLEALKKELVPLIESAETVDKVRIVAHVYRDIEIGLLRQLADFIKQKTPDAMIILGSRSADSSSILVAATPAVAKQVPANELIAEISPMIEGSGGGRAQLAQAGSRKAKNIDTAVQQAVQLARTKLSS